MKKTIKNKNYNSVKTLNDLLNKKNIILSLADKYGLINVRLFGSIVRGEETENSDIDIAVNFKTDGNFNSGYYDRLMNFKYDLSKVFSKEIDVLAEEELRPIIKLKLDKEGIRL